MDKTILESPLLLNTFLEGVGIDPETMDKSEISRPLFEDIKHKLYEIV